MYIICIFIGMFIICIVTNIQNLYIQYFHCVNKMTNLEKCVIRDNPIYVLALKLLFSNFNSIRWRLAFSFNM